MGINNLIIHFKSPLHLCMFVTIFLSFLHQGHPLDPKFEACMPKSCGDGLVINYPFWIQDEHEAFCGYPQFEVTSNGRSAVLRISNDEFVVKNISYLNYSLVVADRAFYETDCPIPLHNYNLDGTPFACSPDNNKLTFFYNCTSTPIDYPTYKVSCDSNDGLHSFAVFFEDALDHTNYSSDQCQTLVNVSVDMTAGANFTRLLTMSYGEILKIGLLLDWTAPDCRQCERSGGRCGFEHNQFLCFCKSNRDIETFLKNHERLALGRYRFSEVKRMTNGFKTKLGEGGYGTVYKGKLPCGTPVAVKFLNKSKGNGQDFINEVVSIGRTSHVNIVTLLGFCLEGRKKALIYEYMSNGSLDKLIYMKPFDTNRELNWKHLHQIAIGIARGLEYLHRGCNTRILHFDIKPHNILLDDCFRPKISDFGLAKLCHQQESTISMLEARGTIGYIAPEVFNRNFGRPSYKSDVYSYGMMVLEMVGGRRNFQSEVSHSSEIYFPEWIHKHLELGIDLGLDGVVTTEDNEIARKMIVVGIWCAQTIPSNRPSIPKVIEMLEGTLESLQMPPKPSFSSPPRPPVESSTT